MDKKDVKQKVARLSSFMLLPTRMKIGNFKVKKEQRIDLTLQVQMPKIDKDKHLAIIKTFTEGQ